jgi:hypothetical protein
MKTFPITLSIILFFMNESLFSADSQNTQQIDQKLASTAELILRVERLASGEGSKYLWYDVRVIEVLSNPTKKKVPRLMSIAALSSDPGIPPGTSTIYLENYSKVEPGHWKLVGGKCVTGVSHNRAPTKKDGQKGNRTK